MIITQIYYIKLGKKWGPTKTHTEQASQGHHTFFCHLKSNFLDGDIPEGSIK